MKDDLYFLYKVNNAIIERHLLQPRQKILIAVSGGQDSICLLRILFNLKKKWSWKLGIIHCDHRWNPHSKLQAKHVAYLAAQLQIDYHQGITVKSIQKEGMARVWRYDLIQTVAISNNYTAIVTGHNASDRIETFLYNLTRGSGLHGLQSIKWKRSFCSFFFNQSPLYRNDSLFFLKKVKYKKSFDCFFFFEKKEKIHLIRPLLNTTRTEVRNILNQWNFSLWLDNSNQELRINRNRIRHRLIPYIRFYFNLNIDQTFARWAEIVQAETFYLEELTNYILSKFEMKKKRAFGKNKDKQKNCENIFFFSQSAISIELLHSLPVALQRRVLKEHIYKITGQIFGFHSIEQIRLSSLVPKSFCNIISIRSMIHERSWIYESKLKKEKRKKNNYPWIILPSGIKLLIFRKYLFLFLTRNSFFRDF